MVYKKGFLPRSPGYAQHFHTSPPNTTSGRSPQGLAAQQIVEQDSDVDYASVPQTGMTTKSEKRVFGPTQDVLPDGYEKRYPPDEYGQEMGPNARVWRVYLDEAELNDLRMAEKWKDDIDALLFFAGIFSAVITTFVTQTSRGLSQDFGQVSASLLAELVAIQRSLAAGSSLDRVLPSNLDPSSPPQMSTSDAWVDALWFASLSLSLLAAFYAMLIRQWVQRYISPVTGTPQQQMLIRHFRYIGIQRWSVPSLIGGLPTILYIALFLFTLGLVIFLQAVKPEIASVVGLIGGLAFVLYFVTSAIPVFYPQCPYRTPVIEDIYSITAYTCFVVQRVTFTLTHRIIPRLLLQSWATGLRHKISSSQDWCKDRLEAVPPVYKLRKFKEFESKAAEEIQDEIESAVIRWLLTSPSDPSVKPITLQSISGLRLGFSRIDDLLGDDSFVQRELSAELRSTYPDFINTDSDIESFIGSPLFYATERTLRASMLITTDRIQHLLPDPIAITRRHLQMHMENLKQDIALQHALTTYMVSYEATHILFRRDTFVLDLMPILVNFLNMADKYPIVWRAWFNSVESVRQDVFLFRPNPWHLDFWRPSFVDLYRHLEPFFDALFDQECSPETWGAIAPFIYKALPPYVVEGYSDILKRFLVPRKETMGLNRAELGAILLKGVIAECKSDPRAVTELENVVVAARSKLLAYPGRRTQAITISSLAVLDELCNQSFFANSSWSSQTYLSIFSTYLEFLHISEQQPASFIHWIPTPLQYVFDILSNKECASGLIQSIFYLSNDSEYDNVIHGLIHHIMRSLDDLRAPDPLIDDVMDILCKTFQHLDGMPSLLTPTESPVEVRQQWPSVMQPLVKWMLVQIMAQDGAEHPHPTIYAVASKLVNRTDMLTFVCSSFLIDSDGLFSMPKVAFSEESYILLQLAISHKDKAGAANVWSAFLSWVVDKSVDLDVVRDKRKRNKENCERYVRMVKFVDRLVSTLGLNGSEFKLPPLVGRYAQLSTHQANEACTAQSLEGPSAHSTSPKRSILEKLIPWKARSDTDANREEIALESNQSAVAEEFKDNW